MVANGGWDLTLILLTWTIWRAPANASKWRMGFNSAFKGLKVSYSERKGQVSRHYFQQNQRGCNLECSPQYSHRHSLYFKYTFGLFVSRAMVSLKVGSSAPPPRERQPASGPGPLNKVDIPLSIYTWIQFGNNKLSPKIFHIKPKSVCDELYAGSFT